MREARRRRAVAAAGSGALGSARLDQLTGFPHWTPPSGLDRRCGVIQSSAQDVDLKDFFFVSSDLRETLSCCTRDAPCPRVGGLAESAHMQLKLSGDKDSGGGPEMYRLALKKCPCFKTIVNVLETLYCKY